MEIPRGLPNSTDRINSRFYGGAICTAELCAVANTNPGTGDYVTLYFNSVVWEKDGKRLGQGSRIERLRGVSGGQSQIDPTAGMGDNLDDEIPF